MALLQLLPAIVVVASLLHAAAATGNETSSNTSCAPATCGNVTIRTFREHLYRVDNIFYDNSSLVVAVQTTFAGDAGCPVPDFNVSSSLTPYPYTISSSNKRLVFVYNCSLPEQVLLPGTCADLNMGSYISGQWNSTSPAPAEIPGNCSSVSVPVSGFQFQGTDAVLHGDVSVNGPDVLYVGEARGFSNASIGARRPANQQYERLISDGFLLEWQKPEQSDITVVWRTAISQFNLASLNQNQTDKYRNHQKPRIILIAGLLFTCLVWIMHRRKRTLGFIIRHKYAGNESNTEEVLKRYQSLTPKRYRYSDMKKITKCFKEKLGEGGYGMVFKGNLKDGHMVAVKLLKGAKGNGEEFLNEVTSIGRTSHGNIVKLLGFCLEGSKRALVYEYMANGSLGKYIYSENLRLAIGLESLQKIAIGVARGLDYLHQGCSTRMSIIHFDIKPNNILLDEDFCPKIADFGLAKLCHLKDSASMAEARGTIGFIAPEVFSRGFGVVSTKSDVYSYGMMLLEMVEGRNNVKGNTDSSSAYFLNWIYDHLVKDLESHEVTCESEEIARKITLVGLWCIQTAPKNRPSMSKIIEMLEKNINELEMPPKPILSCPSVPSYFSSCT
uniref:Protein kinase domain-containing protein n=1 Tax=Oryza brachyantha TaxID=4533 RepID=J3KW82_ORYBR